MNRNQSALPPINDWNQVEVDARAQASIDELLSEMRANRQAWITPAQVPYAGPARLRSD